jgi:predicted nucleotide-binding protein
MRGVRAAFDAILERTDAVRLAGETVRGTDRRLLLDGLPERLRSGRQPEHRARNEGSGAIAQGPGATAAGAGGVAIGGSVSGGVVVGGQRPSRPEGRVPRASRDAGTAGDEGRPGHAAAGVRTRQVAVVHGRNESARRGMFEFLRSLGLHPVEFTQAVARTGVGAPYVGDVLWQLFDDAPAAVVLLTGDEVVQLRRPFRDPAKSEDGAMAGQSRPNVLFEAGLALGRQVSRTVLVQIGCHRPFSDVAGRHIIEFTGSAESRNHLAGRLATAGCAVDRSGQDWLTAGGEQIRAALAASDAPIELERPGRS